MNPRSSTTITPSRRRAIAHAQPRISSSDNSIHAFVAFLAEHTSVRERSARQYVAHLARFAAWLQAQYQAELLEATTRDVRAYRAQLAEDHQPASVNTALAALRRFYAWAADTERLARNPSQHLVDLPEQPLAPNGFSDVERRRLRREAERAGPIVDAVVSLLLNTGLRVEELVSLTWEQLSLQPRSGWADVVGKRQKRRRVPLNVEARQALLAILPASPSGPVFRGKRGPYTQRGIHYLLAELGRRANVEHVHPHRFRHDTARRLVESVDLPTVAAMLGHERLDTVRIYSQPDEAALERAAVALERT